MSLSIQHSDRSCRYPGAGIPRREGQVPERSTPFLPGNPEVCSRVYYIVLKDRPQKTKKSVQRLQTKTTWEQSKWHLKTHTNLRMLYVMVKPSINTIWYCTQENYTNKQWLSKPSPQCNDRRVIHLNLIYTSTIDIGMTSHYWQTNQSYNTQHSQTFFTIMLSHLPIKCTFMILSNSVDIIWDVAETRNIRLNIRAFWLWYYQMWQPAAVGQPSI